MRFFLAVGLAASLSACLLAACGGTPSSSSQETTQGVPGVNASIAFSTSGPLVLAPGQFASLVVSTTPPASYEIAFRLVGESLDASLDAATLVASEDGTALLSLRAPSHSAAFAVHATIKDGPTAELVVSVSDQGFSALHVLPKYEGGRPVDSWVALAAPGTTCEALAAMLPADPAGALTNTASPSEPLFLTNAPVGPTLAVVARAGHFAWGCTDVMGLTAGTVRDVDVYVTNKPLDPKSKVLDVALGFAPDEKNWGAILAEHRAQMAAAFTSKGSEPKTLLAAFLEAAPAAEGFAAAASEYDWLAAFEERYALMPVSPAASLFALADAPLAETPLLRGQVEALDASHALFQVHAVGALSAEASGAPTEYLMTLGIDPSDNVHLGGSLFLMPSRYVGAQMTEALGASVPQWLSDFLGCSGLPLVGIPACDGTCIQQVCELAFTKLWDRALDASANANAPAEIPLKVSGKANFDDDATLTGFEGSWLGQVHAGELSAKVNGKATATLATMAPPK